MTSPPPTVDSLTDRELVARYVSLRDEIAFAALVRRHSSLVLGICHRVLGHRQDVEDAFQATFLVLARDAHRVRKRESLASWLHGVAYRTSLRAAEGRHRRIRLLQDVTMIEDTTLADVEHRHQRQLLDEELEALPEKFRDPLILHYLEGQTAKEVAQTLKLSTSTVEGRLKRGRKELHLRLVRRGLGLSIAVAALSVTPQLVTAAEAPALVGSTIHAGLSYTAGDPAGPLFTHEAARLATQETLAMTLTTTTATVTALLIVPVALALSGHDEPGTPSADAINTAVQQLPLNVAANPSTKPVQLSDANDWSSSDDEYWQLTQGLRARLLIERKNESGGIDTTASIDVTPRILGVAAERPLAELDQRTELEFVDTPLQNALKYIGQLHNVTIHLHKQGLEKAGVPLDAPITATMKGLKLRDALSQILEPLNLRTVLDNQSLVVTAKFEDDRDVSSIEASDDVSGLNEILSKQTSLEFTESRLSEVIRYIAKTHGVNIVTDTSSLSEVGVDNNTPITLKLNVNGIKLESALGLILKPLKLGYLIDEKESVIKIASQEDIAERLEDGIDFKIRSVDGLVDPVEVADEEETAEVNNGPSAQEARILQKLEQETQMEYVGVPLSEVFQQLGEQHDMTFIIHENELSDIGVPSDEPINMRIKDVRLRSAMKLMLEPLTIGFQVKDDVVHIRPQASIASEQSTPAKTTDEETTEPQLDLGGGIDVKVFPVTDLVVEIPSVTTNGREHRSWHFKRQSENEQRIELELDAETELEFVDTPLSEAINYIAQNHNITILINDQELQDAGVPTDEPVNLIIKGVKLETALNIILRPLQLGYMLQDEVMYITTQEHIDAQFELRVYDLPEIEMDSEELVKLVVKSIQGNWEETGGDGTIVPFDEGLAIRQTQPVHREIEALFEQLEAHTAAEGEDE